MNEKYDDPSYRYPGSGKVWTPTDHLRSAIRFTLGTVVGHKQMRRHFSLDFITDQIVKKILESNIKIAMGPPLGVATSAQYPGKSHGEDTGDDARELEKDRSDDSEQNRSGIAPFSKMEDSLSR